MILSILFIFLFLICASVLLIFIFSMLLPSMRAEGIEIKSPVFSHDETEYEEDLFPKYPTNTEMIASIDPVYTTIDKDTKKRMIFSGYKSCSLFYDNYKTQYFTLEKKCIGFGDCVKVCPQKGISIKNNVATISRMCAGCGRCVEECPVKIISLVKKSDNNKENEKNDFKFIRKCYKIFNMVGE